jgi:hypothetical protein
MLDSILGGTEKNSKNHVRTDGIDSDVRKRNLDIRKELLGINTGWSRSLCAHDDDQKVCVHLTMAITEYIRNVDRAILNTVRRVNKCLETDGGHFEHYL